MKLAKPPKTATDRRADALIDRAQSVQSSKAEAKPGGDDVPVTVRLPKSLVRDIDRFVHRRLIRTTRNTWLREAIYAKWEQEKKKSR